MEKRIVRNNSKFVSLTKKIGYNMDILWQKACMTVNPTVIDNTAFVFNCTTLNRSSDQMTALSDSWHQTNSVYDRAHRNPICGLLLFWLVSKKGERKVQGVPQSQTAALPRHQEEEETDKSKQAQID